jgi:hypothetical protein
VSSRWCWVATSASSSSGSDEGLMAATWTGVNALRVEVRRPPSKAALSPTIDPGPTSATRRCASPASRR